MSHRAAERVTGLAQGAALRGQVCLIGLDEALVEVTSFSAFFGLSDELATTARHVTGSLMLSRAQRDPDGELCHESERHHLALHEDVASEHARSRVRYRDRDPHRVAGH